MQSSTPTMASAPIVCRFTSLPTEEHIEVEYDADDDEVEIRSVEPCGAVSGSVFVRSADIPTLVEALTSASHAMGGQQ